MKIIKRTLIFRECPGCKIGAFVRKDGIGKYCRKCRAIKNSKIPHYKDMTGLRFGKLLATKFVGIWNSKSYYWHCICDCGNESIVLNRCYNENNINYNNYGGRGIKVCDEWRNSFDKFHQDMIEVPKGKTLDRINYDGNYYLENCKWSTYSEQAKNRRKRKKKK